MQPYQPPRQAAQPRTQPVAVPTKPQAARTEVKVSVPAPEQFGIRLDEPAVVVPTPGELGIDLRK